MLLRHLAAQKSVPGCALQFTELSSTKDQWNCLMDCLYWHAYFYEFYYFYESFKIIMNFLNALNTVKLTWQLLYFLIFKFLPLFFLVLILNLELYTKSRQTQFLCLKLFPNWQQRWNANKWVKEEYDKQLLSWSWHFWEMDCPWCGCSLIGQCQSVSLVLTRKLGEPFSVGKISFPNMQGFAIYKKRVWWNHFGILIFILKKPSELELLLLICMCVCLKKFH